jgi:hypothetical protein
MTEGRDACDCCATCQFGLVLRRGNYVCLLPEVDDTETGNPSFPTHEPAHTCARWEPELTRHDGKEKK